jgi:hypothetical protein
MSERGISSWPSGIVPVLGRIPWSSPVFERSVPNWLPTNAPEDGRYYNTASIGRGTLDAGCWMFSP